MAPLAAVPRRGPHPHGVRTVEDRAPVARLAERGLTLHARPPGDLRPGRRPSPARHRLPPCEPGVPVTVNSDDPTMLGTTLNDELAAARAHPGLDAAAVRGVAGDGSRSPVETAA